MATRKQIQSALQQPYDRVLFAKEVLHPVFGSGFKLLEVPSKPHVDPTKSQAAVIDSVNVYATITLDDETDVTCYEVKLQPTVRIEQSKVAIQQYVRNLLIPGQAALINFVSPVNKDMWRFTLVARDSAITDAGIEETQTHPQRYTYLVEKERPNRTMAERMEVLSLAPEKNLQALIDAFSVERMSKAFFDEYKQHYENFNEYLTSGPFLKSVFNGNEKEARDFIKKLMGRIVFLYFVQKKRWLGASTTKYTDGPYDFIFKLFEETGGDERFFPFGLTELFFNVLNTKRKDDDWQTPGGVNIKVPYLNGGLFVRDKIDELIRKKGIILTFPPGLFSHADKSDSPNDRGFLDFLNAYNFTVYEDSMDDHTVAVDPEMLGHIFENLLEDNKDKGAFYTPKEIVHYMCQESLTEYLATNLSKEYKVYRQLDNDQIEIFGNETRTGQLKMVEELGDKSLNRADVEAIVKEKDISNLTTKQLKRINELLDSVKICDPAIGSGAFPMGLLLEIFTIKEAIAYKLELPFEPARVKESIIQNSVYGVDIEKGAVDIARLRFWLSLVVDEEQPRALPNLDYKIVVGNSLVSKFEDEIIEIDWDIKPGQQTQMFGNEQVLKRQELLYQISQKQKAFFDPENGADKNKLKQEIRNLKIDILINQLQLMINSTGLKDEPKRSNFKTASAFTKAMEKFLESKSWENTIKKLQALKNDPEKPFEHFDWKLDFPEVLNPIVVGDKGGFDIVIANPPYIKEYTNRAAFDGFRESPYYQGKMDIWYGFACKSIDMLKTEGVECFIAQNNWITSAGASIFRNKVVEECEIKLFTDFGNYKVFESAGIQTMIYLIQNRAPKETYDIKYSVLKNDSINKSELVQFLTFSIDDGNSEKFEFRFTPKSVNGKTFTFTDSSSTDILERIKSNGNLYLTDKEVANGIHPHYDFVSKKIAEASNGKFVKGEGIFGLSTSEKNQLNLTNAERDLIKPYYTTEELDRFYANPNNQLWIIYTGSEFKNPKSMASYPNLKKHLDRFKDVITSDNKPYGLHRAREERFFKGESIVAQRKCPNRPSFTYTDFDCYVSATFYVIQTSRVNMKYLTALLNSKLIAYWLRNKGKMQGNNFQIDKAPLLEIPIRKPNAKISKVFEKLVIKILNNKAAGKDTTGLEQEIDNMVYRLYDLTYKEVKVIDPEFPLSKKEYENIKLE